MLALPVYANWRQNEDTSYSELYPTFNFWVYSKVRGDDQGDYFDPYENDWDHGDCSDPPPPFIFCYYDSEEKNKKDGQGRPYHLETYSTGNVKLKTGQQVDFFWATAELDA